MHSLAGLPIAGGALAAAATGYGTVGVRGSKPFCDVRSGTIDLRKINYSPRG